MLQSQRFIRYLSLFASLIGVILFAIIITSRPETQVMGAPLAQAGETNTPSATASATASSTSSVTASATASSTASITASATASATASSTASITASATASSTATITASATASGTATDTDIAGASNTPTTTATASPTDDVTNTLAATTTASETATLEVTATPIDPSCLYPIPNGSVQGRVLISTLAFYDATLEATTDVLVPGGTAWWIINAGNGFYQIWIACYAQPVWVLASNMSPNFDEVWNGAPLPDAGESPDTSG